MKSRDYALPAALAALAVTGLAVQTATAMPVGNRKVPEPATPVELTRYLGLWYEMGRYENRFEKGCDFVTAEYSLADDGRVNVINTCGRQAGEDGKVSKGKAKVLPDSGNAKLKVSFFGPFYFGNYWVLDHAEDYSWSIVGEPSGKYLWILTRQPTPVFRLRQDLTARARELGYDTDLIRWTKQDSTTPAAEADTSGPYVWRAD
ncbi:lipocalin family protein [Asticcacaulis sp. AND118]|uniref:lipocalin family protein n=1 Tax=Asticcacaulis sp. AND118 TaxID=2840468 RepID=UPI001CFFD582|nr:lipocalin family protein [Asticcacaulis sp. AND118]UDF05294.1 lipocalin family protein [Asticcacaulis sp. AND118]